MSSPASELHLATPEAVALSLEVAGLGYRALAWLVDAALILVAWSTLILGASYVVQADLTRFLGLDGWLQALSVLGLFLTNWGYGLLWEGLWRGQTPGKRALGLRVVRADGSPATFLDCALRNLCRGIDFLPAFYVAGVACMLATERSRRLGDLVAGTLVVREREADLSRYQPPPEAASGQAALGPEQLELVLEFLGRAAQLDPPARGRLAVKLAGLFAARAAQAERAGLAEPAGAEAFLRALARGEA